MADIISVGTNKGGTRKSTCVWALGNYLADLNPEKRILVIDGDFGQGNLTTSLLGKVNNEFCIEKVILEGLPINECIFNTNTPHENLYILPAGKVRNFQNDFQAACNDMRASYTTLKDSLDSVREYFDVVLIDHPATLSVVSSILLCASDFLLIPMMANEDDYEGFEEIYNMSEQIKERTGTPEVLGILRSAWSSKTTIAKDLDKALFETNWTPSYEGSEFLASGGVEPGTGAYCFSTSIRFDTKLREYRSKKITPTKKKTPSRADFIDLCQEISERITDINNRKSAAIAPSDKKMSFSNLEGSL